MTPIKPRISVDYTDKAVIIKFADEKLLDDNDIAAVRDAIMSVVEQTQRINLVLDFTNVKFLSSAVLGLLIRVSKKVYERDGQLRLCNINPKIYEIFKITRLTKVFEIYPDTESAIEGFAALD
jgi:anti-sigma B factor antagonist